MLTCVPESCPRVVVAVRVRADGGEYATGVRREVSVRVFCSARTCEHLSELGCRRVEWVRRRRHACRVG